MNKLIRTFLLFLVSTILGSCGGGGGNDTPSIFDGRFTGHLYGVSCISNLPADIVVEHEVDATGDGGESEATVNLVDQDGNSYNGPVILTASTVGQIWGFSVDADSKNSADSPDTIFYNIAHTATGEAEVEAIFIIPRGDPRIPVGCSYSMKGVLVKN